MNDQRPGQPAPRNAAPGDDRGDASWSGTAGTRLEWSEWSWQGPRVPGSLFGGLLILVGGALLLEQLVPSLSLTTLLLLAVGLGLTAAWLVGNVVGATVPGLVILAWALARLAAELDLAPADGLVPAFVGIALVIAWLVGRAQGVAREWALWLGVLLAAIGLADVVDILPELFSLDVIVPVAVIALGVVLIARGRRG